MQLGGFGGTQVVDNLLYLRGEGYSLSAGQLHFWYLKCPPVYVVPEEMEQEPPAKLFVTIPLKVLVALQPDPTLEQDHGEQEFYKN